MKSQVLYCLSSNKYTPEVRTRDEINGLNECVQWRFANKNTDKTLVQNDQFFQWKIQIFFVYMWTTEMRDEKKKQLQRDLINLYWWARINAKPAARSFLGRFISQTLQKNVQNESFQLDSIASRFNINLLLLLNMRSGEEF